MDHFEGNQTLENFVNISAHICLKDKHFFQKDLLLFKKKTLDFTHLVSKIVYFNEIITTYCCY